MLDISHDTHRRFNILTGEWVLVSPFRNNRPWQGKQEELSKTLLPSFVNDCYLCPGNTRAGGEVNPNYTDTFSFINDFGAINSKGNTNKWSEGLLKAQGEIGLCKVICFSPDHSITIPDMSVTQLEKVISLWQKEYTELGLLDYVNHVQIFENKGNIMGCSNSHPHGQIWAQNTIPGEANKKTVQQTDYWNKHNKSLLQDYLKEEIANENRIIDSNEHFVALIPFWAVWPYESMIIPRRRISNIVDFAEAEKTSFAVILKRLTQAMDRLFNTSFAYSSGIHQAPTDGNPHPEWCMHMSFYPPLLRSATVKKFMVGYEMFAEPQRDITAEQAAEQLRSLIL